MRSSEAVLSVDFELFSHTPAYRQARGRASDPDVGLAAIEYLLTALRRADANSTFFVVSDIADSHADVIRRISDDGHEVGSHTHTHPRLPDVSAESRAEELTHSKARLESVTETSVLGFRAPVFDLALDHFTAVRDAGYDYDSSVVPARRIPGWYGGEHASSRPSTAASLVDGAPHDLVELPVGVMPGVRLPLTGTWLRFFGVRYTLLGMRLLARRGIAPVLYVHPWEFVDLPEVPGVPKRVYWRTGAWMRRALETILDQPFEFVTAESVVEAQR